MIPAVTKTKGVPELMDGLLGNPDTEDLEAGCWGKAFLQPVGGYDAGLSAQLGLPIDVGQDRNKEIHFNNGNHLDRVRGSQAGQLFKDRGGMILISAWVKGKVYVLKKGHKFSLVAKYPNDFRSDLF
jgi:hypothetical protein